MKTDRGSSIPLLIGLSTLLLLTILTVSELQSLLVTKQRAMSDARFAALFVAKSSGEVPPVVGLDYSVAVRAEIPEAAEVKVFTDDQKTFVARVCLSWRSPFGLHAAALICDEAKARVIA
ncbi:MAG: hypothetical protein RL488_678 [Actinomycetota bacterium]